MPPAAAPLRRSTRLTTKISDVRTQFNSKGQALGPWAQQIPKARTLAARARCESVGCVSGPGGAAPRPDHKPAIRGARSKYRLAFNWIFHALDYFILAVEALKHSGVKPGRKRSYIPPPVPYVGHAVAQLLDVNAPREVTNSFRELWRAFYALLGYSKGAPGLPGPPYGSVPGLPVLPDCFEAGSELADAIRGLPEEVEPHIVKLRKWHSKLERGFVNDTSFWEGGLAPPTLARAAVSIWDGYCYRMDMYEIVNAAAVPVPPYGTPFDDYLDAPRQPPPAAAAAVQTWPGGWVAATETGVVLAKNAANKHIRLERTLLKVLLEIHRLAGVARGYDIGRIHGSPAAAPASILAATAAAEPEAAEDGYITAGSIAAITARAMASHAVEAACDAQGIP